MTKDNINNWALVDEKTNLYLKIINDTEFELVSIIRGLTNIPESKTVYLIARNYIDLKDYAKSILEDLVFPYGYTLIDLKKEFGEDTHRIIAKTVYDSSIGFKTTSLGTYDSFEEADKAIKEYMKSN